MVYCSLCIRNASHLATRKSVCWFRSSYECYWLVVDQSCVSRWINCVSLGMCVAAARASLYFGARVLGLRAHSQKIAADIQDTAGRGTMRATVSSRLHRRSAWPTSLRQMPRTLPERCVCLSRHFSVYHSGTLVPAVLTATSHSEGAAPLLFCSRPRQILRKHMIEWDNLVRAICCLFSFRLHICT